MSHARAVPATQARTAVVFRCVRGSLFGACWYHPTVSYRGRARSPSCVCSADFPHLEPTPRQHRAIADPPRDRLQQVRLRNRVEIPGQVRVDDLGVSGLQSLMHRGHRLLRAASRTVSVHRIGEVPLEDRRQHQHRSRLYDAGRGWSGNGNQKRDPCGHLKRDPPSDVGHGESGPAAAREPSARDRLPSVRQSVPSLVSPTTTTTTPVVACGQAVCGLSKSRWARVSASTVTSASTGRPPLTLRRSSA